MAWMKDSGISTGWEDGTYRPNQQVDRDAMAAFFYRYKGAPAYTAPSTSPFSDITPSTQFYKEMSWMKSTGISTGWDDGTYRPWVQTARDAMAAFIYRAAGSPAYTAPTSSLFTDVTPSTQFYKEMSWLYQSGIATGADDGTFDPAQSVTREMMAVFMYRLANNSTTPTVTTSSLPVATVGVAYQTTAAVSGGKAPYSWTATGLPAGLSISAKGVITGTPTAEGTSSVVLKVADADGESASATVSLKVRATAGAAIVIGSKTLETAVVGTAFSTTFTATGGVAPYKWSATGLPNGITMATGGTLSGTPTAAGASAVTVKVTDSDGETATVQLNWTVNPALAITTKTLNLGVVGTSYASPLAAQGGVAPYKWSATGVPAGLTLSQAGNLSGKPTTAGSTTITVTVTDARNVKVTSALKIDISAANNCQVLKCIAITFDDGPLAYNDTILNALTKAGAKATFYDVGSRVKGNPAAVKRKSDAGMEIGAHGWDHIYHTDYGYSYVLYDLSAARDAIQSATGKKPNTWRPPYGYYNPTVRDAAGAAGLATIMWTDNTWDYEYTNASQLRMDTVDIASRDAVLLMHDGYAATASAIPGIISDLQAQGYTLVTVSMLLGSTPKAGTVYFDDDPTYH